MKTHLTILEITFRLLLAAAVSGLIGYDREHKSRPAGLRTNILVCVGACIIALVQKEIAFNAFQVAIHYPKTVSAIRSDQATLIAQVVSGIGFLGAGTIIVQHGSIHGLTTAASLWVVACIGVAVGMGDYTIVIISTLVVFTVLVFLKKIIHINMFKNLEIQYHNKNETKEFLRQYFKEHHLEVDDVNFGVIRQDDEIIYTNIYEIEIPHEMNYDDIIEDISRNKNIVLIRTVSI
ncbi:MgtC/SapB family protein [Xylocopilactobacillus apis]|uniref:Magnesium transporter MgtC n=1 Tax=Xylocopilactobacillus apis TaxID=2932183 RepID=A0AAU9DKF3_9LACO|nr:MgtC/SapB family protein [Xylocopilactobacillus apis]BDR57312.1 magnesium transporter MgtC [Xylocopilactobacillus apis]